MMKLKYLFLATLATAGMVACSQDDDKVDPNATYDAAVNVSVAPSAETATKTSTAAADEDGDAGESNVKRLTAFIFDASGTTITVSDTTADNLDHIGEIIVKAKTQAEGGTNYQMFIVANLHGNEALAATSLTDLQTKMAALSTETSTSLTMTSKLLTIKVVGVEGDKKHVNYLLNSTGSSMGDGATGLTNYNALQKTDYVPLTRIVARIQLDGISISMVGSNYTGSTFRLDSVYLVNVKAQSYLYTTTGDLTVADNFLSGMGKFTIIDKLISPAGTTDVSSLARTPNATLKSDDASQNSIDFTQEAQANNYLKVYADENLNPTDYKTMLIICGQITLPNGQLNPTKSYYHITIAGPTTDNYYVKRNTIYKITAQITGIGSKNPDEKSDLNAAINARVTVLPWNVVIQTEDDTN